MRDKDFSTRVLIERVKAMKAACDEYGVLFIVNDCVDVVIVCDVDGVYLG